MHASSIPLRIQPTVSHRQSLLFDAGMEEVPKAILVKTLTHTITYYKRSENIGQEENLLSFSPLILHDRHPRRSGHLHPVQGVAKRAASQAEAHRCRAPLSLLPDHMPCFPTAWRQELRMKKKDGLGSHATSCRSSS